MKKRLISGVLLAAMMLTSLAGCGAATDSKEEAQASKDTVTGAIFDGTLEENVTIRVLENDTAISKGYFQELIDAFNAEYAQYGITAVDANMDQYLDLANDGPYGYGPDVLYQANDVLMQYAQGKHIYPLPVESLECYEQVPQEAWDAYKTNVEGSEYYCGVPVNIQAPMLYYRKDLLPEGWENTWDKDANGVPDMAENWRDLYLFSKERHEADSTKYGYMKSIYDVYFSSGFLFSYGAYVFGDENTDTTDIGFAAGDAEKGAYVLQQLAGVMNEDCLDDTITTNAYSRLGDGTYFATLSTPDMYSTFLDEMAKEYEKNGKDADEAMELAKENLVMTGLPKLPESGDLEDENSATMDTVSMGGMNGYAISAYTQAPNACLAFVDFATSYEMMMKRSELLGVAPARADAAKDAGEVSADLFDRLHNNQIVLMPSVDGVSQIWTPGQTFFIDVAKDAFRPENERKYKDMAALKDGLTDMSQQIYDAINTLQ
ncbi:MAG: extracellular solute-binding protein [Lachnospiraceae bacterium]|nr:extracellular solute-binding protein [Lachnospiraceae bacterium]